MSTLATADRGNMADQQKDQIIRVYRPNRKAFPFEHGDEIDRFSPGRNRKQFFIGTLHHPEYPIAEKPARMVIKSLMTAPQINFTFLKNQYPRIYQEIVAAFPEGKLSTAEATYIGWITLLKMGFYRDALIPSLRLIKDNPRKIAMTDLTPNDGWILDMASSTKEIRRRLYEPDVYEAIKKQAYRYVQKANELGVTLPWDSAFAIYGSNKVAPHPLILDMEEMRIGVDDPSKIPSINNELVAYLFRYLDRALLTK